MPTKTISTRLGEVLNNSNTLPDYLESFEELLRKNLERVDQKSTASIFLFASLTAIWTLLRVSGVQKVSIFGMEVPNISMIIVGLPTVAAYAYYQFMCMEGMSALIESALRDCYRRRFGALYEVDLTELILATEPHHVENAMENMESANSRFRPIGNASILVTVFVLIAIPIALLIWMLFGVVSATSVSLMFRIASAVAVILLALRSFLLFIQWMRTV